MRARSILAAMLLVVTLGFAQTADTKAPPPPDTPITVAATVNGQAITLSELDAVLRVALPDTPLTARQRWRLRAAILDDLVDDKLLEQFLSKSGPKVDPAELDAQLRALTAQLIRENQTLAQYLKTTGQTEAQLRAIWGLQNQLAGYVKQQVTDAQLQAYHAANRDYFDKVEVRVSHIVVRVSKDLPAPERAGMKEKLQALRNDIAGGKIDFNTAARKFSQCPSGLKGGDLGYIPRRGLPENEPLAKAAFALKIGGLSEVIESDSGFHLVTVSDRKVGTASTWEKSLIEVLEAYTDDYRDQLVAQLRKEAQIKILLP